MNAKKRVLKRAFSVLQTLILLLSTFSPASAVVEASPKLNFSDVIALSDCEKKLYGGVHTSLPSNKRVEALENDVFGATRTGPLSQRIMALHNAMNANAASLLSPPLAGKMDTQTVATPKAKSAPDEDLQSTDQLPPLAPPIDRAKNALHQALALYSQGRLADAEAAFKRVLAFDHDNSDANFNLGAIAEGRGDFQSALNYYQVALKGNPDDSDAKNAVLSMQSKLSNHSTPAKGKWNNETADMSVPYQAPNSNPIPVDRELLKQRVNEASTAFKNGDYNKSISILQSVAQQAPNEPDVQYALSQSYKSAGQYMAARSALNQAIALSPDNQMYKDALRDLDRIIANGGARGTPGSTEEIANNQASPNSSSSDPVGNITPFTGISNPGQGWQPMGPNTDTYAAGNGPYYPAYANRNANRSTTSRIERAAVAGLAGAAVGALFGGAMSGYGGRGRGAFTGAAMGGLLGVMFGSRW
jgi:tetratricopeptide (TPR) repeat protein